MQITIRYFVTKRDKHGERYYWEPSRTLRAQGHKTRRLSADRAEAIAEAEAVNREVEARRLGIAAPAPAATASARDMTLSDLIAAYRNSDELAEKPAKTRKGYEDNMRYLERWAGDAAIAAIKRPRCETFWRAHKGRAPSRGKHAMRMLSIIWNWGGGHYDLLQELPNPVRGLRMPHKPRRGRLWTRAHVKRFVATADALGLHSIGTAVIVNYWLGQRQGDILALSRSAYKDGIFTIVQSKRGEEVIVPQSPAVKARIADEYARQAARQHAAITVLICEATGRPWRGSHFRQKFRDIREAVVAKQDAEHKAARIANPQIDDMDPDIYLGGLWFMHLRHTAVTLLAEHGCNDRQIASITGHAPSTATRILDTYTVRRRRLAAQAAAIRLAAEAHEGEG